MKTALYNLFQLIFFITVLSVTSCSTSVGEDQNLTKSKKPISDGNVTLLDQINNSNTVAITTSEIRFELSNIDSSTFTNSNINFSPAITGTISQVSASEVKYQFSSSLTNATKYSISVSGLLSKSGKTIPEKKWSFTTIGSAVSTNCSSGIVLCVDDTVGVNQEYSTIQNALNVSVAGDTIVVYDGSYTGFRVTRSGTKLKPIIIMAMSTNVFLTSSEAGSNNFIRINNASYISIEGFNIIRPGKSLLDNYDNACIAARGANVNNTMQSLSFIKNNIKGCSTAAMYLSNVNNLIVKQNNIESTVASTNGKNGNGIYISNAGANNATVIENKIIGNGGNGIHFNGDLSVGGNGIQTGHLLARNIISRNTVNGFNMDGVRDSIIINNIFANNNRHGIRGYRIDAKQGPGNNVIVNNTFYSNKSSATKFSGGTGGHIIFNNLLVSNFTNSFVISDQFVQSNNLISTDATLFSNVSISDFRLKPGTVAVNGGVASFSSITAPTVDLSSNLRSGLPDVGAFEQGNAYPSWY